MTETIELFGIKFNPLTKERAIGIVKDFINGKGKCQVSFPNVYSVVKAQKDEEFKIVLNSSSLVLADGMPIVWASKLFGMPIPERIAGHDFFLEFCKVASKDGYKFFLLGSTQNTLQKMCLNLQKRFPELETVGMFSPPFKESFSEKENEEMITSINAVNPDVLIVGMTAPKQEKWIYQNLKRLNVKVAIGIGAAFDFYAGTKRRAPEWMQRYGLEWFWRLWMEPKRLWKRYLIGNMIFLWLVLKELVRKIFR